MKAARAVAAAAANAIPANEATDTTAFVDDDLPALLGQASQLVSSAFHHVVLAHGLSVAEWRVLASLADSQSDRQSDNQSDNQTDRQSDRQRPGDEP